MFVEMNVHISLERMPSKEQLYTAAAEVKSTAESVKGMCSCECLTG